MVKCVLQCDSNIWRFIEQFQIRKQETTESIDDYVHEKRRLALMAKQPDTFVVAAVIQGFHKDIKDHIMRQPHIPETLDGVMKMVKSQELLNAKQPTLELDITEDIQLYLKDLVKSVKETLSSHQAIPCKERCVPIPCQPEKYLNIEPQLITASLLSGSFSLLLERQPGFHLRG